MVPASKQIAETSGYDQQQLHQSDDLESNILLLVRFTGIRIGGFKAAS